MIDGELYARSGIALVMLWGFGLKLAYLGYQEDEANGPDVPFKLRYLWRNSMKWRIIGSLWFVIGLAYIGPYAGFARVSEYVLWDAVPAGHLGVGMVGVMGDDLWLGINAIAKKAKEKLQRRSPFNGER